jgi:hypothetical protein
MRVVDAAATKVPLVVGQEWVAAKATALEVEAGVEATRGIAGTVVVAKIIMVIARSNEEMHTDAAEINYAGRTVAIIDMPVTMMSNVDRSKKLATTRHAVVPVAVDEDGTTWGPNVMSGDPDPISTKGSPVTRTPAVRVVVVPATRNPEVILVWSGAGGTGLDAARWLLLVFDGVLRR